MLAELSRLNSHLVWLGTHALDIGAMSDVLLLLPRARRHPAHLRDVLRPAHDDQLHPHRRAGAGAAARLGEGGRQVHHGSSRARWTSTKNCWTRIRSGCSRTKGVGFISLEDMLDLGVTGPMLRAAGLALGHPQDRALFELREVRFQGSDAHRERRVRAVSRAPGRDARRARKIITQALEGMPEGAWQADAPHVVLPDREKMKTQMEALIYHFKIVTEGFRVPAGEVYQCVESPRGEIGYYIVSDGTSKPYRVHMRTPSFGNLQALPAMLEGTLIADSIAALGSMDFVLGDTDR